MHTKNAIQLVEIRPFFSVEGPLKGPSTVGGWKILTIWPPTDCSLHFNFPTRPPPIQHSTSGERANQGPPMLPARARLHDLCRHHCERVRGSD